MKNAIITSTLLLSFVSATAVAHHPAEDMVDPDIYAMIDDNVADTPHADLTFDDMGSDMEVVEDSIDDRDTSDMVESGFEVEMAEMRMGGRR